MLPELDEVVLSLLNFKSILTVDSFLISIKSWWEYYEAIPENGRSCNQNSENKWSDQWYWKPILYCDRPN